MTVPVLVVVALRKIGRTVPYMLTVADGAMARLNAGQLLDSPDKLV